MLRKAKERNLSWSAQSANTLKHLEPAERDVIVRLSQYPTRLQEAAREYSPSVVANYVYELAKEYNQFYQAIPVLNESDPAKLEFRLAFSQAVADVLKSGMAVLGIRVPDRM
jgi:arginyl-tRNA synthetase